jgi:8-amino-7-oxononanoate synthase
LRNFARGKAQNLAVTASDSAIQPLIVGENSRAAAGRAVTGERLWVTAIRPPTVPPGTARLRLTLTAAHEPEDITQLLEILHDAR